MSSHSRDGKFLAVPTIPANAAFLSGHGVDIEAIGGHHVVILRTTGEPPEVITSAEFDEWYSPDN